ncbi:hypothetical protein C8Q78DRAFT_1044880 [Trametes maxima]|nr:hypothetical protein C8Q78DRAFT_1044880 [Trametes maxima]
MMSDLPSDIIWERHVTPSGKVYHIGCAARSPSGPPMQTRDQPNTLPVDGRTFDIKVDWQVVQAGMAGQWKKPPWPDTHITNIWRYNLYKGDNGAWPTLQFSNMGMCYYRFLDERGDQYAIHTTYADDYYARFEWDFRAIVNVKGNFGEFRDTA